MTSACYATARALGRAEPSRAGKSRVRQRRVETSHDETVTEMGTETETDAEAEAETETEKEMETGTETTETDT